VDLSPREHAPVATRRKRPWPAIIVLVVVLLAGGVVVVKFLTSAIDYYCNVDEVGVKSGCETGRRLRIQGTVEEGTVRQQGGVTTFMIAFNGKELPVRYQGEPGGIFQECIPVVVHGRLTAPPGDGGVFVGDLVEVKHSNEYEAANKDRLDKANSTPCTPPQA
jgi:cytochrome c-type biogenesis protein CcmE